MRANERHKALVEEYEAYKARVEQAMQEPWRVQCDLVSDIVDVPGLGSVEVTAGGPSTPYRESWAQYILRRDRIDRALDGIVYKAGELIKQLSKGRIKF